MAIKVYQLPHPGGADLSKEALHVLCGDMVPDILWERWDQSLQPGCSQQLFGVGFQCLIMEQIVVAHLARSTESL